jgi:two-component system CheB/CheR fusion protein
MQKIFLILRARTGHDFSNYKPGTIRRRLIRRMMWHGITSPEGYVRLLEQDAFEAQRLFQEFLITVTSFFRDQAAFRSLARTAVPALLADRPDHSCLRIWAPGCASGEEVYSIAILFQECIDATERPFSLKIFGTDLDAACIAVARKGRYPASIAADVSPARLRRYFTREARGYKVSGDIRELATFAVQNVINDPPFAKLDMVSCRNVLIYLNEVLQERLLYLFHYALKPHGLLFLGPAETLKGSDALFETVDKRWKIFRRKDSPVATRSLREFFPGKPGRMADGARF